MILFFIFFCLFYFLFLFFIFLLGNNVVVGCVLTFRSWLFVVLLFCCVSLARYLLLLKVVCWPCRAGKAYRRARPPH